jgi:hypothetical protein
MGRERVSTPSPWSMSVRFVSLCDGCPPLPFIDARGNGKKGNKVRVTVLVDGTSSRASLSSRTSRGRAGLFTWDAWRFLRVVWC